MRVISKPKPKPGKRCKCVKCGTVVEVDPADLEPENDPRDRDAAPHWVCPTCRKWNY